jgi:hypothetical protein
LVEEVILRGIDAISEGDIAVLPVSPLGSPVLTLHTPTNITPEQMARYDEWFQTEQTLLTPLKEATAITNIEFEESVNSIFEFASNVAHRSLKRKLTKDCWTEMFNFPFDKGLMAGGGILGIGADMLNQSNDEETSLFMMVTLVPLFVSSPSILSPRTLR